MNPSFNQIAELFNVVGNDDPEIKAAKAAKTGKTAEESEELGRQRLSEGDYENAIRHFKEAMSQRDTENVGTMVDLAGAYDYGDLELQALRQYRKALKVRADAPEPFLGISDLYRRSGRFKDSIAELEKAIHLDPGNAYYHIKLAEALREMGEPTKALAAAQYAITVKPEESFYHYWVGDLLTQMKRYEEALQSLRAAIELSPGDDFLYLRAAVAFWKTDRRPEAIKAIRLASDLDTQKNVYHGLLEVLLQESGLHEEAALEHERAEKMDRYDRDILSRTLAEMEIAE